MLAQSAPASVPATLEDLDEALAAVLGASRVDTRRALSSSAQVQSLHRGDSVFRQAHVPPLVLVLKGYAGMRRTTVDGRELMPRILGRGDMIGIQGVVDRPAPFDLFALSDCSIAMWPGDTVRALSEHDSELALALVGSAVRSLEAVAERLDGLTPQGAHRRVARILWRYRHLFFSADPVMTRAHLPELVGTSHEMTRRVLRDFEEAGIVSRTGRAGMQLLDAARLEAAASPMSPDEHALI